MTSRLTKLMFGWENDSKKNLFNIVNNQVKIDAAINNAGWFNEEGERLGNGDLSLLDMQRISKLLSVEEVFLVLTEFDSNWGLPSSLERNAPGKDYVINKAVWMIVSNQILRIRNDGSVRGKQEVVNNSVKYYRVNHSEFHSLVNSERKKICDIKESPTTVPTNIPIPLTVVFPNVKYWSILKKP